MLSDEVGDKRLENKRSETLNEKSMKDLNCIITTLPMNRFDDLCNTTDQTRMYLSSDKSTKVDRIERIIETSENPTIIVDHHVSSNASCSVQQTTTMKFDEKTHQCLELVQMVNEVDETFKIQQTETDYFKVDALNVEFKEIKANFDVCDENTAAVEEESLKLLNYLVDQLVDKSREIQVENLNTCSNNNSNKILQTESNISVVSSVGLQQQRDSTLIVDSDKEYDAEKCKSNDEISGIQTTKDEKMSKKRKLLSDEYHQEIVQDEKKNAEQLSIYRNFQNPIFNSILNETPPNACIFCKSTDHSIKNAGEFKYDDKSGFGVHYLCLIFTSGFNKKTVGNFAENFESKTCAIKDLAIKSENEICVYCNKKCANVRCCNKSCCRSFHVSCARKSEALLQFFGQYNAFCSDHAPTPACLKTLTKNIRPCGRPSFVGYGMIRCQICRRFLKSRPVLKEVIRPYCCKWSYFHFDCIQNYVYRVGRRMFSCPLCKNLEDFQRCCLEQGIDIPKSGS